MLAAAGLDGQCLVPMFVVKTVSRHVESERWRMLLVREAIGTAIWASMVGDEKFEMEGHRMIADVLGLETLATGN